MELAIYKEDGAIKVFTQALTLGDVAKVFKDEIVEIESLELIVDDDFSFEDNNFKRNAENWVAFNAQSMGIGELSDRIIALFKEESQITLYNVKLGNTNFGLTSRAMNDFIFTFWEQAKLMNFLEAIGFYREQPAMDDVKNSLESGKGYATMDFQKDFNKAKSIDDFAILRGYRDSGKFWAEERARRLREMNVAFEKLEDRFVMLMSGIKLHEIGYALRDEMIDVRDLIFEDVGFYKADDGIVSCEESMRFCEKEQLFGELINRLKELELYGEYNARLFGKNDSFILIKGEGTNCFEMSFSQEQPLKKMLDFIEFFADESMISDIKDCKKTGDRYATADFRENFFKCGSVRKYLYFLMEESEKERTREMRQANSNS